MMIWMDQVWGLLPEFGPENTLLLDNEARKFGKYSENGIVVSLPGAWDQSPHCQA